MCELELFDTEASGSRSATLSTPGREITPDSGSEEIISEDTALSVPEDVTA